MSRKAQLRVVAPDEKPAKKAAPKKVNKPKTVTAAAEAGTTRDLLVAMRDRIAKAVEDPNTPPRDLASLTKRLIEVVRDIEAIDAREQEVASVARRDRDDSFDASAI